MSLQDFTTLDEQTRDQLACTFATLLLHDEKRDITADSINKVLKGANLKVAPYWPLLMAKSLQGKDISSFLHVGGSGSGPEPTHVEAHKTDEKKGKDDKAPEKKPEPVPEKVEVEDIDMGGLFD